MKGQGKNEQVNEQVEQWNKILKTVIDITLKRRRCPSNVLIIYKVKSKIWYCKQFTIHLIKFISKIHASPCTSNTVIDNFHTFYSSFIIMSTSKSFYSPIPEYFIGNTYICIAFFQFKTVFFINRQYFLPWDILTEWLKYLIVKCVEICAVDHFRIGETNLYNTSLTRWWKITLSVLIN